jgi:hypothetical protein
MDRGIQYSTLPHVCSPTVILLYRQLQPRSTSCLGCSPTQKREVPPGTSQNVPKIDRGSNLDLLALRRYVAPDLAGATVGRASGRAAFTAHTIEHNPLPLGERARARTLAILPSRHFVCVHGIYLPYGLFHEI